MERETKTVTTPENKELVLKSYLTAKERNGYLLELAANGLTKASLDDAHESAVTVATIKSAKKLFETAIVRYDGSAENIAERLDDVKSDEYDFVLNAAGEVLAGNFRKAK